MAIETIFDEQKVLPGIDRLAALAIFLLPLIYLSINSMDLPRWIINITFLVFLGWMVGVLVLAAIRGFPRWSFPYMGFFLTILAFYSLGLFLWGLFFYPWWMLIFGPRDYWPLIVQLLYSGSMEAFTRFLVLCIALVLIYLLGQLSHVQDLWFRVRSDWTYLSFLSYGGLVFYIWLIFDEYQYENPWSFVAFSCLAIGGIIYLCTGSKTRRLLALIAGATAAMGIIAVGKWIIVPLQNWPVNLELERIFETLRTLVSWAVNIAALLVPALITFLPSPPNSAVAKGTRPHDSPAQVF
jgi:hypothetical protein